MNAYSVYHWQCLNRSWQISLGFHCPSDRQLQRDLAELIKDGTVVVIAGDGSAPHYVRQRINADGGDEVLDEETWEYLLLQVKQELLYLVASCHS